MKTYKEFFAYLKQKPQDERQMGFKLWLHNHRDEAFIAIGLMTPSALDGLYSSIPKDMTALQVQSYLNGGIFSEKN